MQYNAIVFDVDHGFGIGGNGLPKGLDELWFPGPLVTVSGTELLVEVAPFNRRVMGQMMEAVGKPDVDIERC